MDQDLVASALDLLSKKTRLDRKIGHLFAQKSTCPSISAEFQTQPIDRHFIGRVAEKQAR